MARITHTILLTLLVFTLSLFSFGCSKPDDIVLGSIFYLSTSKGEPLEQGLTMLDGMQLAIDELNERGGINGRHIRLEYRDAKGDPELAKKLFEELRKSSPALIFTMYTHISMAISPLAAKYKIPLLALQATAEAVTQNAPYTFRYWPTALDEARGVMPIVYKLKATRICLVYMDNDYGKSSSSEMIKLLSKNNIPFVELPFKKIDDDFRKGVEKLDDCDTIHITAFPNLAIPVMEVLRESFPNKNFLGPSSFSSPDISKHPLLDGTWAPTPLIYNPSFPFATEVGKEFTERFETPFSHHAAIGYDSINLLAQIMAKGGTSHEEIKAELESAFIYPGLFGDVIKAQGSHDFTFPLYPARIMDKKIVYQGR
ncbi:ABC transporter substrate-binding protein [Pseudodesulfovibrio sp.]|nr:ABC transporter substrate-binding protein [Pseudodesulfovibrio sp.]